MEASPKTTIIALAIAGLLLGAYVPTAGANPISAQPTGSADECVLENDLFKESGVFAVSDTITVQKVATPRLPASTLLYALLFLGSSPPPEEDRVLDAINGRDAYIIDFGCEIDASMCLTGDDRNADAYDLEVTFRDATFGVVDPDAGAQSQENPLNPADSIDICEKDSDDKPAWEMPDDTRYVEIITRDGLPAAGGLDSDTVVPGVVEFEFEMAI